MFFFWLTLRGLLFLITMLAVIPMVLVLIHENTVRREHEIKEVSREVRRFAQESSRFYDALITEAHRDLSDLAEMPQDLSRDTSTPCDALLAAFVRKSPHRERLLVAGRDGEVYCSSSEVFKGLNIADAAEFKTAVANLNPVTGEYRVDPASGKAVSLLAQPVVTWSGELQAVLLMEMNLSWFEQRFVEEQMPQGSVVLGMDPKGTVIYRYPDVGDWVGKTFEDADFSSRTTLEEPSGAVADVVDLDGVARTYGFVPLRASDGKPALLLGVGIRKDIYLADIETGLRIELLAFGLLAALASAGAFAVSRQLVVRPMDALVAASRKLGVGDLSARSGLSYRRGELGQLARSFDQMAEGLQRREETLERLRRREQMILESAGEGINGVDAQGDITFINPVGARMLGWEVRELIFKPAHETIHHSRPDGTPYPREECPLQACLREGKEYRAENEVLWRKDGTSFPTDYIATPVRDDRGGVTGAVVVFQDITERLKAEGEVRARLRERETLLRELHHRVKNNLQVISSLLNLQSQSIKDGQAQQLFREAQNRVQAMSLIHEQLYRSENLSAVNMGESIPILVANLYETYGVNLEIIGLKINVGHIQLSVEKANPYCMIINELVSNALKHAFPGGRHGEISIDLQVDGDSYVLVVKDNGVGLPDGLDLKKSQTLGLQFVNSLTAQLNGSMEYRNNDNGGAGFKFVFPV